MSTQGLIAVVDGDKVLMKIVAGCNGSNAWKLAKWLWKLPEVPSAFVIANIVEELKFGCRECLVIQTDVGSLYTNSQFDADLYLQHYVNHFSEPRFNPRLPTGEAPAHTIVLDISKKKPELDYFKLSARYRLRLAHSLCANRGWSDAWGVDSSLEDWLYQNGWLERKSRPGGFDYWYQYRPTQRALRVLYRKVRKAEDNA